MFCTNCGAKLPDDAVFCTSCGAKVEEAASDGDLAGAPDSGSPVAQPLQPSRERASIAKPGKPVIVAAAAAAAIVVLIAVLLFVLPKQGSDSPAVQDSPSESASSQSQSGSSQSPSASSKALGASSSENKDEIQVKQALSDYTWDEVAAISKEIESQAASKSDAIALAAEYNLVSKDGTLSGTTKELKLSDGSSVDVFIVGVFQDRRQDGKYAAFTFMTSECYSSRPMNQSATNAGGWKSSDMRTWLNSSVMKQMPSELISSIVPVEKKTNNAGQSRSATCVSTTYDSLWLFSWKEVLGSISWNANADTEYIDTIDNAEGTQYDWFVQQGVAGSQDHPSVSRAANGSSEDSVWWMRSSTPNNGTGFGDMGPEVDDGGRASTSEGVVFGFCI